jgi:Type II intron maturase
MVAQYQAEYRGLVQYYRLAYNLHTLSTLRHVMEVSLVRTLANKDRTTCTKIYQRDGATIQTDDGPYRGIRVTVQRHPPKKSLPTYFGGLSLQSNTWARINDQPTKPIWSGRSELVERLLAQACELCGSPQQIAVHHVRKLADLPSKHGAVRPEWKRRMAARRRKTLIVCRACHELIQYGNYDGKTCQRT